MKKIILGQIDWGSLRLSRYLYLMLILVMGILVARMVVYSPDQLIIISIGILILLLCLTRTWTALLLLLYFAPFYGFVRWTIGISPVQAMWKEAMVVLLTLGWAIHKFVFKREKLASTPLNLPLFLFLWLAIIQLFRASNILQGLLGLRMLATYIPIYFIVANMTVSKKQIRSVIFILMIIGVVTASYGLWQASVGLEGLQSRELAQVGSNLATMGRLRIFSTFAGPEYLGLFMVLMIIIGVALWMSGLSRPRKRILLIAMAVMFAALVLTLVRLEWFMLGMGLVLLTALVKKKKPFGFLLAGIIAVLIIFPPYIQERATMTFTSIDESFQGRMTTYLGWNIPNLLNNPLGVGLGGTSGRSVYERVTGQETSSALIGGGGTESGYFNVALEMGIPGLILYLWLFIIIIRYGLRTFRTLSDSFLKHLALGITTFVILIFFCQMFGPLMQTFPAGDLYFWFFVALLLKLKQIEKEEDPLAKSKPHKEDQRYELVRSIGSKI